MFTHHHVKAMVNNLRNKIIQRLNTDEKKKAAADIRQAAETLDVPISTILAWTPEEREAYLESLNQSMTNAKVERLSNDTEIKDCEANLAKIEKVESDLMSQLEAKKVKLARLVATSTSKRPTDNEHDSDDDNNDKPFSKKNKKA